MSVTSEPQPLAGAGLGVERNDRVKCGMTAKQSEQGDENKVPAYLCGTN